MSLLKMLLEGYMHLMNAFCFRGLCLRDRSQTNNFPFCSYFPLAHILDMNVLYWFNAKLNSSGVRRSDIYETMSKGYIAICNE